jgi:hypothetical protein
MKQFTKEKYLMFIITNKLLNRAVVSTLKDEYEAEGDVIPLLNKVLKKKTDIEELVIGGWCDNDNDIEPVYDWIVKNSKKLQNLKSLFLFDVPQTFTEISWINLGNIDPIFKALPDLLSYGGKGMQGLELSPISSNKLMRICLVTGGLSVEQITAVLNSDLPALVDLELWLGSDSYGGNYSPETFDRLLSPIENGIFPSLHRLGLLNINNHAEGIYKKIPESAIVKRITVLDISEGTISDDNRADILKLKNLPNLEEIIMDHNYFSEDVMKELMECVDANLSMYEGEGYFPINERYCTVSE